MAADACRVLLNNSESWTYRVAGERCYLHKLL